MATNKAQHEKEQTGRREIMKALAEIKIGSGLDEVESKLRKA